MLDIDKYTIVELQLIVQSNDCILRGEKNQTITKDNGFRSSIDWLIRTDMEIMIIKV